MEQKDGFNIVVQKEDCKFIIIFLEEDCNFLLVYIREMEWCGSGPDQCLNPLFHIEIRLSRILLKAYYQVVKINAKGK